MSDTNPSHVSIRATVDGPQGGPTEFDDPAADRWHVSLWGDVPGCPQNYRQIECIYHRTYRRKHAALKRAHRLAEYFSIDLIDD